MSSSDIVATVTRRRQWANRRVRFLQWLPPRQLLRSDARSPTSCLPSLPRLHGLWFNRATGTRACTRNAPWFCSGCARPGPTGYRRLSCPEPQECAKGYLAFASSKPLTVWHLLGCLASTSAMPLAGCLHPRGRPSLLRHRSSQPRDYRPQTSVHKSRRSPRSTIMACSRQADLRRRHVKRVRCELVSIAPAPPFDLSTLFRVPNHLPDPNPSSSRPTIAAELMAMALARKPPPHPSVAASPQHHSPRAATCRQRRSPGTCRFRPHHLPSHSPPARASRSASARPVKCGTEVEEGKNPGVADRWAPPIQIPFQNSGLMLICGTHLLFPHSWSPANYVRLTGRPRAGQKTL